MVRAATMCCCLVVSLSARPVSAQNTEVKRFLNVALTMYENLEYEKALKQLKSAHAKAAGPDDEMHIALLEGVILADMGKEERALTAFKTGFGFDLDARLPVDVSPKTAKVADKARANVRKMLGPQIEREQEENRLAAEKRTAEAAASKVTEDERAAKERQAVQAPVTQVERVRETPSVSGARVGAWVAGGIGLLSVGAATFFLVSAQSKYSALTSGTANVSEAASERDTGKSFATVGYTFTAVAAAGLLTSAILFIISGKPKPAALSFSVMPGGGFVTFGAAF